MTIGTGIAIAGMWLAVGVIGYKNAGAAIAIGFFAMIATVAVAGV